MSEKSNKDATVESVDKSKQDEAVLADEKISAEICEDSTDSEVDVEALQAELAAEKAKVAANWEQFLAAKAETDNVRKRSERDVSNAHKYALEKFLPDLLAVKDSLELGTKAAQEGLVGEASEQITKFIEGSEMTINLFADALKKANVETIDPQGEIFNPELHQAMTMIPSADVEPNTIIEVIQKGYVLNERLVRPAMVIVAKAV